ncbi:MAG: biotin carboxylase N-terminal domain-containing protein [bacterium]
MQNIKKILIANRGEIALRINATCHALNIQTIGVYAPEDMYLSYVYKVDQAYLLSQAGINAYLNQEEIIEIALQTHTDAIHPGYGFLSENAIFAQKVIDAGLIWIGPDPQTLALTAHKTDAKNFVEKLGIPIVPGFHINGAQDEQKPETNNLASAHQIAHKIGFPVILKDPLSGGGKAMKLVHNQETLEIAWDSVQRESKKLTNSQQIIIEKYLQNPRHIEIQIAGDGQHAIHLYERECSIQRRHQKIIEEAPCQFIPQETKEALYDTATIIANNLKYKNLGTIEFLVMPDQSFYFLEINPRLQVEHSITEITTGLDLVALQIEIAQTGKLPVQQEQITQKMHAIECRIYSEDPANNFFPSTGLIDLLSLPHGPFIRHEHDLSENMLITSDFDPMLSKLITHGPDRACAIGHMKEALNNFIIAGVTTNISFLKALLNSPDYISGNFSTQFLHDKTKIDVLLKTYEDKVRNCAHAELVEASTAFSQEEIAAIVTLISEIKQQKPVQKAPQIQDNKRWKQQVWE